MTTLAFYVGTPCSVKLSETKVAIEALNAQNPTAHEESTLNNSQM